MSTKKIITVLGARPQFIKAAPVSRAIHQAGLTEKIIHTGQHYDPSMSDVFFEELSIPMPSHRLGVGSGSHAQQTGKIMILLEDILISERPDWLLVYGDTNSTLAGALTASKLGIPIAHVEAGLRSFNRSMPEEINRIATDHLSQILFTPTDTATRQLNKEGFSSDSVLQVGDVMLDAALHFSKKAEALGPIQEKFGVTGDSFILATLHRASNTDNDATLLGLMRQFEETSEVLPILLPIHPRTRKRLSSLNWYSRSSSLKLIEPLSYLEMIRLESLASLILTDSGGVQKEAFFFQKPCITLRTDTEWVETVQSGWNLLVAPEQLADLKSIVQQRLGTKGEPCAFYGDGTAAIRIAEALKK